MTAEQWRAIPGWEGRYEVSDLGNVRSLLRYRGSSTPRIMAVFISKHGYPTARLFGADGTRWYVTVHRLVALAFLGPRGEGMHVRHLDGDKTNNHLDNLCYGTPSENAYDKVRLGEDHLSTRSSCANGHAFTPANTLVGSRPGRVCRTCIHLHDYPGSTRRPWEVRAWAREAGLPIGRMGRIPASIEAAYLDAHQERAA